jgi:hypothetical protein
MSPSRAREARRPTGSMSRVVDGLVADALRAGFTARTDLATYRGSREVVVTRPGPEFLDGVLRVGVHTGVLLVASFSGAGLPRTVLPTVAATRYFLKTLAAGHGSAQARQVAAAPVPEAAFTALTHRPVASVAVARAASPRIGPATGVAPGRRR